MKTNELNETVKSMIGRRNIDVTIAVDLNEALKAKYPGGFDLDCLDSQDFMAGGFFNETEAKAGKLRR